MKTKLLGILALFLGVVYTAQAQFRIGTTDYPTLSAAVAAVPATGIPTTIEATTNHSMTTAVTVNSGQHIVLKSAEGIFTLKRSAALLTHLIIVQNNATLIMENIVLDGGAIWDNQELTVHADTTRINSGLIAERPLILVNEGATLTLNEGTVLQNNHNTGSGDCAGIRNSGKLTLNNGSMIRLCSYYTSGPLSGTVAGGICSIRPNSIVIMNGNSTIAGCMSKSRDNDAGGIFSGHGSEVVMNDNASIYGCYSTNGGGGITQRERKLIMNGSASIHHCAANNGGGFLGYTNATIEMNGNSAIHDNEAFQLGGGISLFSNSASGGASSKLFMSNNAAIYNNKSRKAAGGVANRGGWIYMNNNASIHHNESETFGGGVALSGTPTAQGYLYMNGGRINHNAAKTTQGGIAMASHATLHLRGGEISYNTAERGSGGVHASGLTDTIRISGGRIAYNKAPTAAGIGLNNQAVLYMTGGEISGNQALNKGGGIYIGSHATNPPIVNILRSAAINNNKAPVGNGIFMAADKNGGPASVFNLGGTALITDEIFLEKDTLNPAPDGDPLRNKFITLISEPERKFKVSTDLQRDAPYGRIIVVPGTATIDGTTYTLADASSYTDKFTHPIKSVAAGLPTTPTAQKLILGCYEPDKITILRTPLGKPAKINVPQTFAVKNASSSISGYTWTFAEGTPASSTAATPSVTWTTIGQKQIELKISEKGVSYAPGDTMRCEMVAKRKIAVQGRTIDFFVNKRSTSGQQTGLSWEDAFLNLDTALAAAGKGDRIWVAKGVYTPSRGSYVMAYDSVEVYGGFAGTESALEERKPVDHPTTLQGKDSSVIRINGNLSYPEGGCGVSRGARWDGFIITGGIAKKGAGILNDNGSPTIANCIIRGNAATHEGGGVYTLSRGTCAAGSPLFMNTEISGNTARRGAGLYNEGGKTELLNVTVSGNHATESGAGMYNAQTTGVKVINTIIYDNRTKAEEMLPNIVNMGIGTEYRFCLIQGANLPNAWSLLGTNVEGNISENPDFVKSGFNTNGSMVAGDYRLRDARSVAYDAGWNSPVIKAGLSKDLAGRDRIYDSRVDIGAYEFIPINMPPIQLNHSITINECDHAKTKPGKGIHAVISKQDFTMTITPDEGYTLEELVITTGSKWQDKEGGMKKTMNADGSMTVIFRYVTESLNVQFSGVKPTATQLVEASTAVWAGKDAIHVRTDRAAMVQIYTVMGTLSHRQQISAGEMTIPMARGLYIVKIDDLVQKVVVR
ncbi:hypothetical protein [Tannerella sp.]|uniref:hypothetical protein n=1 Tax=Tannerella sp. TaxID=2382127 RepID=UPI0026DC58E1|nr:hypothetical protein [Tannerella sp.]MDO4704387.1 hypothetical protein [Tannerella sp.]